MKHFVYAIIITLITVSAQAADVGVSITIGQPGFYGHIDIGNFPRPELIYPKAIIIGSPPPHVVAGPLYLHVPPGHEKHWSKHCAEYNACGRPVYFVTDHWYNDVYVPEYRTRAGGHGTNHVEKGKQKHNGSKHGNGKGHK